ncbi:phytochelatin synthase family protein [Yangia mangrovi]|uniref:glutathione gamma-glutamylcysteinyltransferase n=1 Tax=Alloyangia mangrovi TaxID=1779329 RepID=A0A2A3JR50_9RHOB|nr:phytochelatin synthase family protein [Alloyangia mangrovi]MCA0939855.1 phytochelatin synthase family protein [Alloyangia pacifica]MCA0944993.1 phytochelatin synthase family protein [Alloyangia pacifica]MCT4370049.1 phytochelatin synthase family protein [Alloyangia mangrovi]
MVRRKLIAALLGLTLAGPVMADDLVYLTSAEGEDRLLATSMNRDYFPLASYLEFEQILTFCGPASVAAVANSLDISRPSPDRLYPWTLFTQDTLFNEANQKLKPYAMVEHEGLTLDELDTFIENLGMKAEHHFADETSVDALRDALKSTLSDRNARFIANYSRKALPQDGDGHISPVAAYDEATDSVLILDVAKYKYPPVWVSVETLHAGMMMVDSGSNRSRGFVVVSVP